MEIPLPELVLKNFVPSHLPRQAQLPYLEQFPYGGYPLEQTRVGWHGSTQLLDAAQLYDGTRHSSNIQRHSLIEGGVVGGATLHTLQHLQQRMETIA